VDVADIPSAVRGSLRPLVDRIAPARASRLPPGSRGIANMPLILRVR
jgi:hypothetical protein